MVNDPVITADPLNGKVAGVNEAEIALLAQLAVPKVEPL
jgi:hypothetical protein